MLERLLLRVNLVERCTVGEMVLVGFGPSAKALIDGEQRQFRKLAGVLGLGLFARRTVVVAPGNVLAFV